MSLALPNLVLLVTATLFVACAVHSAFYVGVKRETWLYWTLLTLFFGAVGVAGDAMYDVFLGRTWGKL